MGGEADRDQALAFVRHGRGDRDDRRPPRLRQAGWREEAQRHALHRLGVDHRLQLVRLPVLQNGSMLHLGQRAVDGQAGLGLELVAGVELPPDHLAADGERRDRRRASPSP